MVCLTFLEVFLPFYWITWIDQLLNQLTMILSSFRHRGSMNVTRTVRISIRLFHSLLNHQALFFSWVPSLELSLKTWIHICIPEYRWRILDICLHIFLPLFITWRNATDSSNRIRDWNETEFSLFKSNTIGHLFNVWKLKHLSDLNIHSVDFYKKEFLHRFFFFFEILPLILLINKNY